MPSARRLLLALLLAGCLANIAITARRSLLLVRLDGEVERIDVRNEKHPGVDDVYLVSIGGITRVVDPQIGRLLRRGDRVVKDRFSLSLSARGKRIPCPLSRDTSGMLALMPIVAVIGTTAGRAGASLPSP